MDIRPFSRIRIEAYTLVSLPISLHSVPAVHPGMAPLSMDECTRPPAMDPDNQICVGGLIYSIRAPECGGEVGTLNTMRTCAHAPVHLTTHTHLPPHAWPNKHTSKTRTNAHTRLRTITPTHCQTHSQLNTYASTHAYIHTSIRS